MRKAILCTLALLAAACSPPASTSSTEEDAASQSAAAGSASAGMRPGRWSKIMTVAGEASPPQYDCVTTSDLTELANEPNSNCTSANGFQRTAEGLVYEAECTGEDGGGRIRTVVTGDMQNSYTAVVTTSGGGMDMEIRIDGTYEGACRGDE